MGNLTAIFGERGFVPAEVEDRETDFSAIPKGDYYLEVEKAEVKPTKNGKGQQLEVTFTVLGVTHEGRKVFARFMLEHSESKMAVDIGQSQLKSLCSSVGIAAIGDTDELLGQRVLAHVGIRKDDVNQNEVKSYKPVDGTTAPAPPAPAPRQSTPTPQPTQPAAATAKKKMPWEK